MNNPIEQNTPPPLPTDAQVPDSDATTIANFENRNEEDSMSTVREDVTSAMHFLLAQSAKPAVLVARDWGHLGVPHFFEHMAIYQEVAALSDCFIMPIDRLYPYRIEHLAFMTWVKGITEKELLECIDLSPNDNPTDTPAKVWVRP